jgi:hypothetical protein
MKISGSGACRRSILSVRQYLRQWTEDDGISRTTVYITLTNHPAQNIPTERLLHRISPSLGSV